MINIQNISNFDSLPDKQSIINWAKIALDKKNKEAEIVIRIVENKEGQALNKKWCKILYPITEKIIEAQIILVDIVICANVVFEEAKKQKKSINEHFAHMVIHGILHLQGYDHITDTEKNVMEKKEIAILDRLGYRNPYVIDNQ